MGTCLPARSWGGERLLRVPSWFHWEEGNEIKQEKLRLNTRKCFPSWRCKSLGICFLRHGVRI